MANPASSALLVIILLGMFISLAIWGRREILTRTKEEELRPYLARLEEKSLRRRQERERKRLLTAGTRRHDGDDELLRRLQKVSCCTAPSCVIKAPRTDS
jgi:hypothetical protein